jgi:hypothetical protein
VSRKQGILHGQQPIILGLILMALVYAAISAARTFGIDTKLEFVALGGLILAWASVLLGTLMMRKERPEFDVAFYVAIVSLASLFVQTGLGVKNFLNNMADQTFIQFDVMFFGYIALLGMVIVYRMMMKGIHALSAEKADKKVGGEWKSVWLAGLIVIFAGTLFIPVTSLFSGALSKGMAGVIILLVLGMELFWCQQVSKAAGLLHKKR